MTSGHMPSRVYQLPDGLRCRPRTVEREAWQAHVAKHPLGAGVLGERRGAWNAEGWDRTVPPVVSEEQRDTILKRVMDLPAEHGKCGVREFRGGRSPKGKIACYACVPPLLTKCSEIMASEGVGQRYAAETDRLIARMEEQEALVLPRSEVSQRLLGSLQSGAAWVRDAALLAIGLAPGEKPVAHISEGNGTACQLWLNGRELVWKTTYRQPTTGPLGCFNWLMRLPRPFPRGPLSDKYVVPRGWWESDAK